VIATAELTALARAAGFDLAGCARAEPIPPAVLQDWLAAGYHADLDWMAERVVERLDVTALLPGAKTVLALACNYWRTDEPSPIARYARGRDYHATLRDRLRTLRRSVRARWPEVQDYGSVDANPVMEKVHAVRAGLGTIGKNACLITPEFGSYVVLAVMLLDVEVDTVAPPQSTDVCGRCRICLDACPTGAIVADRVVDARACLSYQTIENEQPVPEPLRGAMTQITFGCDICQDVCPLNVTPVKASERFVVRPHGSLTAQALAALSSAEWDAVAPGSPLARAGYDGVRRNAAYALGAAHDLAAKPLLERLSTDASQKVAEAARWALARLGQ
jgi:epoxyqueuosine reductase